MTEEAVRDNVDATPVTGLRPLDSLPYDTLDSSAGIIRELWGGDGSRTSPSGREAVTADLLSENPRRRRDAYATAVSRRWLERGEGTAMRALLTDGAAAVDDIQNFESFLSNLRPHPMRFVAERSGFLFLVGPPVDQTVDRNIIDEGARRGVRILGIGTASADSKTHDLATAAEQAALAAQFASSIREFFPSVDISRLGGWVLLRNANLDPSWLSVISPAAATLASAGDETQRRTVEAYLDAGGQVSIACRQLFIHRTTLYYRLERLPLNVRDALADGMQRSALHLALKLVGLWEASGRV